MNKDDTIPDHGDILFQGKRPAIFIELTDLLRKNSIGTTILLIEKYGELGGERKRKKYILYVNCLYELTLGELKDQNNRKELCQTLLDHLQNNIEESEHSISFWTSSKYPDQILSVIALELMALRIDYRALWKHRSPNEKDSIFGDFAIDLCRKGKYDAALWLVRQIENDHLKCSILTLIGESLAKDDRIPEAFETVKEITFNDARANKKYEALANIYTILSTGNNRPDAEKAISLAMASIENDRYEDVKFKNVKDLCRRIATTGELNRIIILVKTYEYSEETNTFLKFAGRILGDKEILRDRDKTLEWRSEAYMAAFEVFESAGNTNKSGRLLKLASKAAGKIKSDFYSRNALTNIAVTLAKNGRIADAVNTISDLKNDSGINQVYEALSLTLSENGQHEEAFKYALMIGYNINKFKCLLNIASNLIKNGNTELADKTIKEAETTAFEIAKGVDSNPSRKNIQVIQLSEFLAETGFAEKAFELNRKITDPLECDQSLEIISIALAKKGDIKASMLAAERIVNDYDRATAFVSLYGLLAQTGRIDVASDCLLKSFEIAGKIQDNYYRDSVYENIAEKKALSGKVTEALSVADLIKDAGKKLIVYNKIADILSESNRTSEAISIMEQIAFIDSEDKTFI